MQIYTNNKTNSEAVSKALFLGLTPKSLPAACLPVGRAGWLQEGLLDLLMDTIPPLGGKGVRKA